MGLFTSKETESSSSKQTGFTAAQFFNFKVEEDEAYDSIVITEVDDWELPCFVNGDEVAVHKEEEVG